MDITFSIDARDKEENAIVELLEKVVNGDTLRDVTYQSAEVFEETGQGNYKAAIEYTGTMQIQELQQRDGKPPLLTSSTAGDVWISSISNNEITVEIYNRL